MSKVKIIIIAIVLVYLINQINAETKTKRRRKWCHTNELTACAKPMLGFSAAINATGIVTTEAEFEVFCKGGIALGRKCMEQFFKKCANNPLYREIAEEFVIKSGYEAFNEFCNPNGIIKARFLKYAPCLHSKVKLSKSYRETCVKQIQAGFEHMQNNFTDTVTIFKAFCCVYNRWEKCISDHLIEHCGPESPNSIKDLIKAASMSILPQVCPMAVYDPISPQCLELYPPINTHPLGAKSNNFFSYMFSYACPNVGYGLWD